jgi:hypothetical protein
LFTDTFPTLAKSGLLAPTAKIWLPNLQCIEESLSSFHNYLKPFFDIRLEHNAQLNPLYAATDRAEEALLLCPDLITNTTQVLPILQHSRDGALFYVLELKPVSQHSSPTSNDAGKKRSRAAAGSPETPSARRQRTGRAQE